MFLNERTALPAIPYPSKVHVNCDCVGCTDPLSPYSYTVRVDIDSEAVSEINGSALLPPL